MSWKKVRLGDVATFVNGYPFKPTDWGIEGYEIIRIQNLTKGNSESNYFSGNIPEKYKVVCGDILISWSATLDIFVWKGNDAWLNQHIFKVVFDKIDIDKSYFIYAIKNILVEMRKQVHGATMQHITKGKFDNLEIPLPPLATQKRIAEILDAADALRRKDQELIKKYDELAQATFINMFGDPVKNEKGWDVTSISGIFDVLSGGTPSTKNPEYWENGDIPWIGSSLCKDNFVFKSNGKFITSKGLENSSAKMIPKNTVIIALVGATIGKIGLIKFETCTNQNVAALIPKNKETISEIFTFYMMKSLYHKFEEVGGDKFKMANLSFVKSLPFLSPPINLQIEFSEIITQIINLKKSTENGLGDELFNTCIQKAFNGELVS
jgi:type I restriction enzyme S subunit